jgi:hypothetical protein
MVAASISCPLTKDRVPHPLWLGKRMFFGRAYPDFLLRAASDVHVCGLESRMSIVERRLARPRPGLRRDLAAGDR